MWMLANRGANVVPYEYVLEHLLNICDRLLAVTVLLLFYTSSSLAKSLELSSHILSKAYILQQSSIVQRYSRELSATVDIG